MKHSFPSLYGKHWGKCEDFRDREEPRASHGDDVNSWWRVGLFTAALLRSCSCTDMAVDITLLFKASVKTVKTRNKAIGIGFDSTKDEIFKRSRPKNSFSPKAKEVVSAPKLALANWVSMPTNWSLHVMTAKYWTLPVISSHMLRLSVCCT